MMIKEIFQIISPFRTSSRASRSAAFGGADDAEEESEVQEIETAEDGEQVFGAEGEPDTEASLYPALPRAPRHVEDQDKQMMDIEEGAASSAASVNHLLVPQTRASRSPSPRLRSQSPAKSPRPLPLADSALLTPGIHKYAGWQTNLPQES